MITLTISKEEVQNLINRVNDGPGIVITEEHVKLICELEPIFAADLFKWGGSDTEAPGSFIKCFCEHVLKIENTRWPKYGDNKDYKINFYTNFYNKCIEMNIKVLWTLEEMLQDS